MSSIVPSPFVDRFLRTRYVWPLLVLVGLAGLYASTIYTNPYAFMYPLALLGGPFVWVVVSGRRSRLVDSRPIDVSPKPVVALWFLGVSGVVVAYYHAGFSRTTAVFALTFVLYLLGAVLIYIRSSPSLALGTILATGLVHRLTAFYSSALYLGVDIYAHNSAAAGIARTGSLAPLDASKYFYAPIYHLVTAIGTVLVDLPVRQVSALTTLVVVTVVPAVFIYAIARRWWSPTVGVLGALLFTVSDHAINWAVHTTPTSLGLVLFAALLFALVRYDLTADNRFLVLFVGLLFALTLTHQVSAFVAVTVVAAYLFARVLYEARLSSRVRNLTATSALVLVLDFLTTKYHG